jgi:hypothetical protein
LLLLLVGLPHAKDFPGLLLDHQSNTADQHQHAQLGEQRHWVANEFQSMLAQWLLQARFQVL